MEIHGLVKYKQAIKVDEKLLRKMDLVISKYYDDIKYSAFLRNNDKIEFETLDELVSYDNFGMAEIRTLIIDFGYSNSLCFEVKQGFFVSYSSTVEARFRMSNISNNASFKREITDLLDKARQGIMYNFFSKLCPMHIYLALLLGSIGLMLLLGNTEMRKEELNYYISATLLGVATWLTFGIWIGFSKLISFLFPPIVFLIGEKKERFKEFESKKSKIWWGIVIALTTSIFANYIFNSFNIFR